MALPPLSPDESLLLETRRLRLEAARLYAIVDLGYVEPGSIEKVTADLVQGGVGLIQLRAKMTPLDRLTSWANKMRTLIPAEGPLFVINDHPRLVPTVGADGIHVGQDDYPIDLARSLAGRSTLVGKSTHSVEQAVRAEQEKVDYIGLGPIYPTATKPEYAAVGLPLIRRVRQSVHLNPFCIGGIKLENVRQVLAAGGQRVVIVSGLLQSRDIPATCREINSIIENYPR